jgi:hypothetical protein
MKKILIAFLILSQFSTGAQTLQASLGEGSSPNRIKIFVKSSGAVASTNISTLQFNLGVLTGITKPTISVIANNTNFPSVVWQITETAEGGYNNFSLTTANAPIIVTSLNTTAEVEVMEVEFSVAVSTLNAALVTLPDGGSTGNLIFLCTGTPSSAGNSLYFARPGVVVTNGISYDLIGGNPGTQISTAVFTGVIVPVHFLSFYAIKSGDDAKLNWTVENDQDNNYFEIQRSLNGISYSSIAKVNAMKNGKSLNTYELADPRLSGLGSTAIYYRIKQVDNNGTITYSAIRNLNLSLSLDAVNLYPNPAKTVTKLVWDVQNPGKGTIVLRDAAGRQVQTISMELVKGINQRDINVSALPSGEYTVTVMGSNTKQTIKLSKIN